MFRLLSFKFSNSIEWLLAVHHAPCALAEKFPETTCARNCKSGTLRIKVVTVNTISSGQKWANLTNSYETREGHERSNVESVKRDHPRVHHIYPAEFSLRGRRSKKKRKGTLEREKCDGRTVSSSNSLHALPFECGLPRRLGSEFDVSTRALVHGIYKSGNL